MLGGVNLEGKATGEEEGLKLRTEVLEERWT